MPGEFLQVGQGDFLDFDGIPASIFEWRSGPRRADDELTIRFHSPETAGIRQFWMETLCKNWLGTDDSDFVQTACEFGYGVLKEFEGHDDETEEFYRTYLAIFRNRHAGHISLSRLFNHPIDFVDFRGPNPSFVAPGMSDEAFRDAPRMPNVPLASYVMERTLTRAGCNSERTVFENVLAYFEKSVATELADQQVELFDEIFRPVSQFDSLLMPGDATCYDYRTIPEQVKGSLFNGPVSAEDFATARDDPRFEDFVERLTNAAIEKSPQEFDTWLTKIREQSYLQLIGGTRLKGTALANACEDAKQMFAVMHCTSYRVAARCWGALVLKVIIRSGAASTHSLTSRVIISKYFFSLSGTFQDRTYTAYRWLSSAALNTGGLSAVWIRCGTGTTFGPKITESFRQCLGFSVPLRVIGDRRITDATKMQRFPCH